MNLQGKNVLITGGTRGVGLAIALRLARAGARVFANYVRDQQAADALMGIAQAEALQVTCVRADISEDAGVKLLLGVLDAASARVDAFIHCAATGVHRPVEKLTLRHFDWTFALNVRSFFNLTVQLVPRLNSGAAVIPISSQGAVHAVHQYTLVGSSKGALESMMRHFAAELAPRGIRVNAISPGTVFTDAWKVLPDSEARLKEASARTPLQRLVTLDEVADVALFLCSPLSRGIIGQTLVVDGGARIVA